VIALALVPLIIGGLAAVFARRVATWLAPAAATILLTSLALTVALATGLLLCLAAVVALAEMRPTGLVDRWSPHLLRHSIPMPPEFGALGGLVAMVLLSSAAFHAVRVVLRARRMSAAAAATPGVSRFVFVADRAVFAYAVPGRHRRIVASTGMLKTLSSPQRRALLAHEEAHLRHHHHVYVQLARLAAAANPLMWPVSGAIDLAVERWADESAARAIGDRVTVARALAAAALTHGPAPSGALAGAQSHVVDRVQALLAPPRWRLSAAAAVGLSVAVCWAAALVVVSRVHGLMELAEIAH
jgi:Zn-dependent protease with chaperone function